MGGRLPSGMGVAPDRYGGHPGPVGGAGIGIINIGYIELGPYFCLYYEYCILPLGFTPLIASSLSTRAGNLGKEALKLLEVPETVAFGKRMAPLFHNEEGNQ